MAMVLSGDDIILFGGRKVTELFLELASGDDSEYDDLECLCCFRPFGWSLAMWMGMLGVTDPLSCAGMAATSPRCCRT